MWQHRFINKILLLFFLFAYSLCGLAAETIPKITIKKDKSSVAKGKSTVVKAVTTIDSKQIKKIGARTLPELLTTIASLQVSQADGIGGRTIISMRGFGDNATNNVLILIDGQPLTNPDSAAPNLNTIPLSSIKEIKIIPTGDSVVYGEQAVGGVINIITKSSDEIQHSLHINTGSFNTINPELNLAKKYANGFNYQLFGRYLRTDNYRDHNRYWDDVIKTRLGYTASDRTDTYINLEHADTNLLLPGALTKEEAEKDRRQAQNYTDYNDQTTNSGAFFIKHQISQNWLVRFDTSFHDMHGDGILSKTINFTENRQNGQLNSVASGVLNILQTSLSLNLGFNMKYGNYEFNDATEHQFVESAFAHTAIPIGEKLTFGIGGRAAQAQYQNSYDSAVITSLNLTYKLNSNWQLYGYRSGNYRFPKTDENIELLTKDHQPLKTQTGVSYTVGTTWTMPILNIDANMYQLELDNEIAYVPPVAGGLGFNENLPPTRRRGAAINANYSILPQLYLSGGYNYVDAVFNFGLYKGHRIPFVADHKFHLALYYDLGEHWHFMTDGIYTGSRFPVADMANQGDKLSAFTIFNFACGYSYKYFNAQLRINNYTNKHYNEYAVYENGTFYYPAAGINGSLNLSVNW